MMSPLTSVYCHGLPGSGAEIQALVAHGESSPNILGPLDFDGFETIISQASGAGVHLIGFSLGAMTALHVAAQYPETVKKITLIAPAAPLELGDFLPNMVGKPVFKIAKSGDIPFKLFTAMQSLSVRVAAKKIIQTMFAGSPAADMDLLSDPIFQAALLDGLRRSLGADNKAYRCAIHHYVTPWASILKDINCPITLHHGTLDNWTPIVMSHALQQALPSHVELITHEGLGHYSTLHKAFPGGS